MTRISIISAEERPVRASNQSWSNRTGSGARAADMMRVLTRESTGLFDDRLALADFLIINLVSGAPDWHAKNISVLRARGLTRVAPLYDLATGLAYDARKVERSVVLPIGGERIASRIRSHQLRKTARTLGLDPELLIGRVAGLAEAFPKAFEEVLEGLTGSTPRAEEVAERTVPAVKVHTRHILDCLGTSEPVKHAPRPGASGSWLSWLSADRLAPGLPERLAGGKPAGR